MKKDVIYFQHDFNARRDAKIISLIDDYGYEGYGRFWALVEILREQEGYIPYNKTNLRALAFELRMELECLKEFISALIHEYELLILENEEIYSKRLLSSIDHLEGIRKKRKDAAEKRWNKKKIEEQEDQDSKTDASVSNCNANAMQTDAKDSIGKNSKVKDRIVKDSIGKERIVNNIIIQENKEEDDDKSEFRKLFFRYNKKPPSEPEVSLLIKLSEEFGLDKLKDAYEKGMMFQNLKLGYIRAILENERNGIKNGSNSKVFHRGNNSNTCGDIDSKWDAYERSIKTV